MICSAFCDASVPCPQCFVQRGRAFARLREMLMSNADLARKLIALENKYDAQFRIVFEAIRELMESPPPPPKPRIGFTP